MANRFFNQFTNSLDKGVVKLYAKVAIGASGAPTLSAINSKGFVSVTRNSAGKYTFVLGTSSSKLDTYNRILDVQAQFKTSSAAPAAPTVALVADSVNTLGTSSFAITCFSGSTATDPASGETMYVELTLSNSSAQ